nr:hypothetical protein [Nostoc sp. C057]
MVKDWFEWHDLYKNEPKLQQRLQIVQEYISHSLNLSQPGLIRVVSVCAGDGRDLLGTLSNHPRAKDVYAQGERTGFLKPLLGKDLDEKIG